MTQVSPVSLWWGLCHCPSQPCSPPSATKTPAIFAGWWFQPLLKILVSWGYSSQYMEKKHVPNHQPASHSLVTESLIFKDPMGPRLRPTQGRSPGADDECHAVPKLLAWRWRKAPGNTQGLHQPNQK